MQTDKEYDAEMAQLDKEIEELDRELEEMEREEEKENGIDFWDIIFFGWLFKIW